MKNILYIILILTSYSSLKAQNSCMDFDNVPTTTLMGQSGINAAVGPGWGNWTQRCSEMGVFNDSNSLNGTNYLVLNDVGCPNGSSLVWNSVDYNGDWVQNANCLCYDFNVITNRNPTPPPPSTLTIYNGLSPLTSTLSATFVLNTPILAGSGWHSICPPIARADDAGNLPSNSLGYWRINNNGTSNDWNNLISNVGGIMFTVDIGGSPTERYGVDNICFQSCPPNQQPNPPIIFPSLDCCKTPLDIWNPDDGQQHPSPIQSSLINSTNLSYAEETFEIHRDATIPITELRVNITDVQFEYNYDQCATCVNNPLVWGSIYSSDEYIGNSTTGLKQPNTLNLSKFDLLRQLGNDVDNGINNREVTWNNPNGSMLKGGDKFKLTYLLPPASEIPCCAVKAKICIKISWKDANCNVCEIYTCSDIDISEEIAKKKI